MKINQHYQLQKVAEQIKNNLTGWIGLVPGNKEYITKGQTFMATEDGDLKVIEVFSNLVSHNGHFSITVHDFDQNSISWGQVIGSANLELNETDSDSWVSFEINGPHLQKGNYYGFRIKSSDSFIGIGETCVNARQPAGLAGQEWQFTDSNPIGKSFSYFSLAYKVEVAA